MTRKPRRSLPILSVPLLAVALPFLAPQPAAGAQAFHAVTLSGYECRDPRDVAALPARIRRETDRYTPDVLNSLQTSVTWNAFQPESAEPDWSLLRSVRNAARDAGLTWIPVLEIDEAASIPPWAWRAAVAAQPGDLPTTPPSPWSSALRRDLRRTLQSCADFLKAEDGIEAVVLSLDYFGHGNYETHAATIRNDSEAAESFRTYLRRRYGKAIALNSHWGARFFTWNEVFPFSYADRPADTAYIELTQWLTESRIAAVSALISDLQSTRLPIYLRLTPGSDRCASEYPELIMALGNRIAGVQVRIAPSDFPSMASEIALIATVCAQRGTALALEAAEPVATEFAPAWDYLVATSGATGVRLPARTTRTSPDSDKELPVRFAPSRSDTRVAVFHPEVTETLRTSRIAERTAAFRHALQFDLTDDDLIVSDGLAGYDMLVFLDGNVVRRDTFRKIYGFVRAGGVLFYPESIGRLTDADAEGEGGIHEMLFGSLEMRSRGLQRFEAPLTPEDASTLLGLASHRVRDGLVIYVPEHCGGPEVLHQLVRLCAFGAIRIPQIRPATDPGEPNPDLFSHIFIDGSLLYFNAGAQDYNVVTSRFGAARRVDIPTLAIVEVGP